jgi:precorrin-6Y C5,15-methyltransferase (decarboxylating) CbiT subunit
MTKEEIRILSIEKLGLKIGDRVLDIGAGTGSVSIQIAKLCSEGEVIGIEKDTEALEVLYKNKEKFEANNFYVIEGEALHAEVNGEFDAIFVGGSGGDIEDIIEKFSLRLKPKRNMVLNFITVDNLYRAINKLRELGYEIECSQISVSRAKGKSLMLMANNPIFIVAAEKVQK